MDVLSLIALAAKAISRLESKDGQEPTAESRNRQPEKELPVKTPTVEDRAVIARRGAALDREFWESQS